MDAELLQRAQKVAELSNGNKLRQADFKEIGEVYFQLTGVTIKCVSCNVYGLLKEITRALIQQPKAFNPMAKYQFKHSAKGVKVIRHDGEITKVITAENLNKGDNAEFIQKNYPHLLEEVKHKEAEAEGEEQEGEAKPAAKKSK